MTTPAALTSFDGAYRSRLASGLVVSLVVHLAAGLALIGRTGGFTGDIAVNSLLPPPEPEQPRVRPGINESRAVTINWLGFESPTEHHATPAETEQAALSPDQPGAPEAVEPAEPETVEVAAAAPAETPADAAPSDAPADGSPAAASVPELDIAEVGASDPADAIAPILPAAAAVAEEAGALAAQLVQVVRRTLAEASESEVPASPPPGEVRDAQASEKEAQATSLEAVKWNPGQPVAAQGLDITPVHPRWNISTRVSALPKNPVVRIDFGKDGRVRKAEFLPGRNTGYRDVDGPLLDALYRWTAKGEALERLSADPGAVVSLPIEIVLMPQRGPIQRSSPTR